MGHLILAPENSGKAWWITVPDAFIAKKWPLNFLQIYYGFGINELKEESEENKDHFQRIIINGLDQKITSYRFCCEDLIAHLKSYVPPSIDTTHDSSYRNKLSSLLELHLYTSNAVVETLGVIDKIMGTEEFSDQIKKNDWFKQENTLRDYCTHVGSLFVTNISSLELEIICTGFKLLDNPKHKQRFPDMQEEEHFAFSYFGLGSWKEDALLQAANTWAYSHIKNLNPKLQHDVFTEFVGANIKPKTKKSVRLEEFIELVGRPFPSQLAIKNP